MVGGSGCSLCPQKPFREQETLFCLCERRSAWEKAQEGPDLHQEMGTRRCISQAILGIITCETRDIMHVCLHCTDREMYPITDEEKERILGCDWALLF